MSSAPLSNGESIDLLLRDRELTLVHRLGSLHECANTLNAVTTQDFFQECHTEHEESEEVPPVLSYTDRD